VGGRGAPGPAGARVTPHAGRLRAWDIAPPEAREIAGAAHRVVCDEIAHRVNAEQAVFPGEAHNPQMLGKPFNDRFREFLRGASTAPERIPT
jgi:hypothetical protein